ncbi:hypothetical protein DV738_g3960, partial [Chaetothyriales sp. CBS 135597]
MVRGSIDDDAAADSSRRLSARPRKLTAKAQALSGSRFLPSDSANIPLSTKSADSADSLPASPNRGGLGPESKISATWTDEQRSSASSRSTYSPLNFDEMGPVAPKVGTDETAINKSPKRSSKRERKVPAKLLEAEPATTPTRLSRKRSAPPSQEEPRYKMRHRRSTAATALDTGIDEASDEYLGETINQKRLRKSTNGLNAAPSPSRLLVPSEDDEAPLVSDTPAVKSKRKMTRRDEDVGGGVEEVLKRGRSEKKAGAPRHSESSLGVRRSSNIKPSSQPLRKYPKQYTKGQKRAGSAPAAPNDARSQITDRHSTSSDRLAQPRPLKRRKIEAEETAVTDIISTPSMARQSIQSHNSVAEEGTTESRGPEVPNSQTRLILTVPLPASTKRSCSSFPAQVRKAEFVDKGCQLFCLDASSRILAFAEIAAELPESDERECRDGEAKHSSLYEKWLELGRSRFCVCGKPDTSSQRSDLTEDELARILAPDGIAQLKAQDGDHGSSATKKQVEEGGPRNTEGTISIFSVNYKTEGAFLAELERWFMKPLKSKTASKRTTTTTTTAKKSSADVNNSVKQTSSAPAATLSPPPPPAVATTVPKAEEQPWSKILEQARAFTSTSRSISEQVHDLVESRKGWLARGDESGDSNSTRAQDALVAATTASSEDRTTTTTTNNNIITPNPTPRSAFINSFLNDPEPPPPSSEALPQKKLDEYAIDEPTEPQANADMISSPLRPTEMPYEQLVKMSEYRQKRRQWTGFIVAAPIAIVVSYELWRRWQAESARRVEEAKRITSGG